jgi:RNA polymerase primary sigma factor
LNWRWIFFINILIVCVHLRAPGIGIASAVADTKAKIVKCATRVSARARLDEILEAKWDWLRVHMHSPEFDTPEAKEGRLPSSSGVDVALLVATRSEGFLPDGAGEQLPGLMSTPLLRREEEEALAREMNYLKFLAKNEIERVLDCEVVTHPMVDKIESLIHRALQIRNVLVLANTRAVKKLGWDSRSPLQNGEAFSRALGSMEKAIDRFDYTLGNRLLTYASWAICNDKARYEAQEARFRQMRGSLDEAGDEVDYFENVEDHRTSEITAARLKELIESLCASIEANLDEREQKIFKAHFGVCGEEARTLEQLGRELGITKERVRQIESRAKVKFRRRAPPELRSLLLDLRDEEED